MPELPEVETIVRDLQAPLSGRTVVRARLRRRDLYRTGSRSLGSVAGSKITAVERFGKAILFRLATPNALVIHLGMTGNLIVEQDGRPTPRRKHRHAFIELENGIRLSYIDPRRFGYFWIGPANDLGGQLNIGRDPFQLTGAALGAILDRRRAPIKSLLLNQRLVSGLGNIYADEILFYAGIHPMTKGYNASRHADALLRQSRAVLRRAIRHGGTTIRDYRRVDGSKGAFEQKLAVYGRDGQPCVRCGETVERIVVSGRSTHFCPQCQKNR